MHEGNVRIEKKNQHVIATMMMMIGEVREGIIAARIRLHITSAVEEGHAPLDGKDQFEPPPPRELSRELDLVLLHRRGIPLLSLIRLCVCECV